MKSLFAVASVALVILTGCVSSAPRKAELTVNRPTVVDAGCGQCLLGLKEKKGCDLAVRLDGKSYFVDGFKMKDLGDAHANDGMCNTLRKAKVTGEVINNRFQARSFDLMPVSKH